MRLKLYELRINNNLSQQELADLAGISRVHYTQIENNTGNKKPSLDVAIAIKKALNYNGDDLFEDDEASTMIGDKIAEQRKKLGLNQEELGRLLNVQGAAISKYESGEIPLRGGTLRKLSEIFDVSVDYLLGLSKPESESSVTREFGYRLRELRASEGITQLQMAEILDISKSNISKYEAGTVEPGIDTIVKIARFFNVTTDYLFGIEKGGDTMETKEKINETAQRIGRNIRSIREQDGLSQTEFAERFNVKQSTVANWENGVRCPEIETIMRFADCYGISLDRLISQDISNTGGENMRLAENMRFLRTQKGLNQRQVADKLGVSTSLVGMWEQDRRTPELPMLVVMAEFYGVTLDELVLKEMKPPMPLYASNLAYLRKKHNMTQQDVAELIGYSGKQGYDNIEDGKTEPSISQLSKLADFFGVTIDQIVKEDLTQEVSE